MATPAVHLIKSPQQERIRDLRSVCNGLACHLAVLCDLPLTAASVELAAQSELSNLPPGATLNVVLDDFSMVDDRSIAAWMNHASAALSHSSVRIGFAVDGNDKTCLLFSVAAEYADRMTLRIFVRNVLRTLQGSVPEPAALLYSDVAALFAKVHSAPAGEPGREYWRRLDWPAVSSSSVPFEDESGALGGVNRTQSIHLSAEVAESMSQRSEELSCTPIDLVQACLAWILTEGGRRWCAIGVAHSFREHARLAAVQGPLVDYIPECVQPFAEDSLRTLIIALHRARAERSAHLEQFEWSASKRNTNEPAVIIPAVLESVEKIGDSYFGPAVALVGERCCSEPSALHVALLSDQGRPAALELSYNEARLSESCASWISSRLRDVLACAVRSDPNKPLTSLPVASDPTGVFKRTEAHRPGETRPFLDLFARYVSRHPKRAAVVCGDVRLTYDDLDQRSSIVASALRQEGAVVDSLVVLLLERSAEWVVAMMGVLKAGAAFVPLDPDLPRERLNQLLGSLAPALVLSQRPVWARLDSQSAGTPIYLEDLTNGNKIHAAALTIPADALAYVIHTSGSTGKPKAVGVTHGNLNNYVTGIASLLDADSDSRACNFAHVSTLSADLGNTCLFPALATGGCLYLMPESVSRDPHLFAKFLHENQIDVLKIVPGHWAALQTAAIPAVPRKWLIFGGERLAPSVMSKIPAGSKVRVVNHYGPTEATVGCLATSVDLRRPTPCGSAVVPLGEPVGCSDVYVLDEEFKPVGVGGIGQIYVSGAGVARGYLSDPSTTAASFVPDPITIVSGSRMYSTGDLARVLPDATLEFIGRIDAQVKIRGYRVEPGEIEAVLLRHADVRSCVVTVFTENETARLVAYVTGERLQPNGAEVRRHAEQHLPEHMVPSLIIKLPSLPLTSNGKVDKAALPSPASTLERQSVAARTESEKTLANIWQAALGVDHIGIHDDFFEAGGDSILSIQIAARAGRAGIRLTPMLLFRHRTIAACLAAVNGQSTAVRSSRPAKARVAEGALALARQIYGEVEDVFPVSAVQHGMLFDCLLRSDPGLYVSQYICNFSNRRFDSEAFRRAWHRLTDRHAVLRTAFLWAGQEQPLQIVLPKDRAIEWRTVDLRDALENRRLTELQAIADDERLRPFDFQSGSMMRLALIQSAGEETGFIWTYHHMVVDGWSLAVIARDLEAFYAAETAGAASDLPAPGSYAAYVDWSLSERSASQAFWTEYLRGSQASSLLTAPSSSTGHIELVRRLSSSTSEAIGATARLCGVTVNALAHGVWALVLHHVSGAADIVTGASVAGRPAHLDAVEDTVGPFLNTIPIRYRIQPEKAFRDWVSDLHSQLAAARDHEHLPLAEILRCSKRTPQDKPLFDTILSFQSTPSLASAVEQTKLLPDSLQFHGGWTSYALSVDIEPGEQWKITVTSDTSRVPVPVAKRIVSLFEIVADRVSSASARTIAELLEILRNADRDLTSPILPVNVARPQSIRGLRRSIQTLTV